MPETTRGWALRLSDLLGTRPEDVTEEDLSRLIAGGVREDADLDFKQERYGTSDSARRDLAGDVAAMANTRGGLIIIGIRDENDVAIELSPVQPLAGIAASATPTSRRATDCSSCSPPQTVTSDTGPTQTASTSPANRPVTSASDRDSTSAPAAALRASRDAPSSLLSRTRSNRSRPELPNAASTTSSAGSEASPSASHQPTLRSAHARPEPARAVACRADWS